MLEFNFGFQAFGLLRKLTRHHAAALGANVFVYCKRLKWIAKRSVDMHLLRHYKRNLAHISDSYSLEVEL